MPGKHIKKLQKTAIFGTAHTLKLLMQKYKIFTMGHNITMHHILHPHSCCNITYCREMLFSGHIIINILDDGDDDDNNNNNSFCMKK